MEVTLAVIGVIIGGLLKGLFYSRFIPWLESRPDGRLKSLLLYGQGSGTARDIWSRQTYKIGHFVGSRWPFRKQRG